MLMSVVQVYAYKKQSIDINVNGTTRNIVVYTPNSLPGDSPLMLVTHGMNQDPEYQSNADRMYELIDTAKFVVAYLRGIDKSWDMSDGGKDKNFVLKAIDEMASRYEIDTNRVYWSGFSMGSMFMYAVMGSMTDKIAAFAPCSGMMGDPSGSIKKKINLIHCHAYGDDVVVYDQFNIRNNVTKIANNLKYTHYTKRTNYKTKNGTSWFTGDREMWKNDEGNEIVLYSFNVDYHNPVSENSYEIWNFCKRYSLDPGAPKVKITSPESDVKYTAVDTVKVSVTASDADGYITNVKLYIDTKLVASQDWTEASESKTYTIDYMWARPTAKSHTIKAVCVDNDGKSMTLSKTITIQAPDPLVLLEAIPEDQSFDLPTTLNTFEYTFDLKVNCDRIIAKIVGNGKTTQLDCKTEGMSNHVVFALPGDTTIQEGKYTMNLTYIYDEREVKADNIKLTYTFGITEVDPDKANPRTAAEIYKGGFMRAIRDAKQLYEDTAGERYASAESLREDLKEVIDEYENLVSTSPTVYEKATNALNQKAETLSIRKEKLDVFFAAVDEAQALLDQYADDEVISNLDIYSKLEKAIASLSKPTSLRTEARIESSTNTIQSYITRFKNTVATNISDIHSKNENSDREIVYDLSGKEINTSTTSAGMMKGIYIINGKKVLVK